MWRRLKAFFGLRARYKPKAGSGGKWIDAHYPGDPHCAPFALRYRTMTYEDRKDLARIENTIALDGSAAAESLAGKLEPKILARRVELQDESGAFVGADPEDIEQLGGESGDAYAWVRRLVLAPYYRELVEGDRAGKVLRRCASSRGALISLLDHAESV